MNSDPGSLEGGRPMRDQAATCPFVGFWPRVGKAAVVLHAVENRTIDLYSIALLATPRIEIPIDGADSPGPDGGYVATGASWPSPTLRLAALSPRIWGKISRWKNPPTPSPSLSSDPLRSFMTWSQMSLGWVNGVPSANTAGGTMGTQPVWAPGSLVTTNHPNVYGTHALRSSLLSGVESSHFSSVRRGFVGATRLFPKRAVALLTESWHFRAAGIERFHQRYGADAPSQILDRIKAAHEGIPATLGAIKCSAETK